MNVTTEEEKSLLMYLETCAVDHDGRVDLRHMNGEDIGVVARWAETGAIVWWKRLRAREIKRLQKCGSHATYHVNLGGDAMAAAHRLRSERAQRGLARTADCIVGAQE